jgi:hypothetical protein
MMTSRAAGNAQQGTLYYLLPPAVRTVRVGTPSAVTFGGREEKTCERIDEIVTKHTQ